MNPQVSRVEPTAVGQIVNGRYELTRLLARGGMGAVYEARNVATNKRCAIKLLLSSEIEANSPAVRRFLHESRSSSAVESDHIVQVFDAGLDAQSGAPYIVMELLRGEDLRALAKRLQVLAPELVGRLALQAAIGLAKAHSAGVVHRDIKPANLFLTERDNGEYLLKIVDFGIAKVKTAGLESQDALTQGGQVVGTPAYMSPEQARGAAEASADCDVWSLGIVMFELITGKLPYASTTPLATLMAAIVTEPIPPLRERAPWVPLQLARVVDRATSRDRRSRFRDAAELRDALLEACNRDTRITRSMLRALPDREQRLTASDAVRLPAPFLGDDLRVTGDLPQPPLAKRSWPLPAFVALVLLVAGLSIWRSKSEPSARRTVSSAAPGEPHASPRSPDTRAADTHRAVVDAARPPPAPSTSVPGSPPKVPNRAPIAPAVAAPVPQPRTEGVKSAQPASRQRAQLSDAVDEFR
jgi:eukaryotic-like serine/threonine-protein kinase